MNAEEPKPTLCERAIAAAAAVLFILATPLLLVIATIRDGWEFVVPQSTDTISPSTPSTGD